MPNSTRGGPGRLLFLLPLVPALGAVALLAGSEREIFDLLVTDARIVDGSGGPSFRGSIGIAGGRIARIGRLDGAGARRVVNAAGRVAAPGFIDVHVHLEEDLPARPDAENLIADGVTTVVTGNCGASAPEVGAWLSALERSRTAVNVATLVGHNTVRRAVMGNVDRAPTPRELAEMEALVRRAMRQGAVGFSTGLIYTPGAFATAPEIVALARAAGQEGGIYATHMRSENDRVLDSIAESIAVARRARVPLQISHFKVTSRRLWGASAGMLKLVARARREGVDVAVDQYPYTASSSGLEVLLPDRALAAGREGVRVALRRRLARPAFRRKIAREMLARIGGALGHRGLGYAVVASSSWAPSLEGKSLAEINREGSAEAGLPGRPEGLAREIETAIDLCAGGARSGLGAGACGTQMVYHTMSEPDVESIFADPWTMVARDGGVPDPAAGRPHPRSYGASARVLSRFVRERGLVSLEEAVRKMTSLPARRFGFRDRGLLAEGYRADLILFDPERVEDLSTFEDPHRLSRGFDLVVVNGRIVREDGRATRERPGEVVRQGRGARFEVRGSSPGFPDLDPRTSDLAPTSGTFLPPFAEGLPGSRR